MTLPIFVKNIKIFEDSAMTTEIISEVQDVAELTGNAIHAIWTGTPVGTLITEASNSGKSGEFVSIDTTPLSGVDGQYLLNVEKKHYRYIRVRYYPTSGNGTLNCYFSGSRV